VKGEKSGMRFWFGSAIGRRVLKISKDKEGRKMLGVRKGIPMIRRVYRGVRESAIMEAAEIGLAFEGEFAGAILLEQESELSGVKRKKTDTSTARKPSGGGTTFAIVGADRAEGDFRGRRIAASLGFSLVQGNQGRRFQCLIKSGG